MHMLKDGEMELCGFEIGDGEDCENCAKETEAQDNIIRAEVKEKVLKMLDEKIESYKKLKSVGFETMSAMQGLEEFKARIEKEM